MTCHAGTMYYLTSQIRPALESPHALTVLVETNQTTVNNFTAVKIYLIAAMFPGSIYTGLN